MKIELTPDDPRIGTAKQRPALNILEKPYNWPPNNRQQLGNGRYVVLPDVLTEPIEVAIVERAAHAVDVTLEDHPVEWIPPVEETLADPKPSTRTRRGFAND